MDKKTKVTGNSLRHAFQEIIWPRRKLIGVGLILIVFNRLSGLVLPYSTKYLVDDVLGQGQFDLLYPLLGALVVAVMIQAGSAYALTLLLSVEAQHLIAQLRSQVQRHVLTLPVRFFDSMKSGELVSRIMNDVEGVRNLVGTGLVQLVGGTITAIVRDLGPLLPGALVGGSVYAGKSGQNQDVESLAAPGTFLAVPDTFITIYEVHAQYRAHGVSLRGLFTQAFLDDAGDLSTALARGLPPTSPIAKQMVGGYVEVGNPVSRAA